MASADTIIAGAVNTTRGEYRLWIKEDGTNSTTYFADAIELELASNSAIVNRGALSVGLFTDISLDATSRTSVSVPSQINPASTASVLERIASTLPLNDLVSWAALPAEPQLAAVAQPRNRGQRNRQSE